MLTANCRAKDVSWEVVGLRSQVAEEGWWGSMWLVDWRGGEDGNGERGRPAYMHFTAARKVAGADLRFEVASKFESLWKGRGVGLVNKGVLVREGF